ncbi:MAG TPA: hypothetical protein ENJ00_12205 [Phycisphaerales bacterium]|nr:hypothetical protein [Phycisphaerales bacterium]
MTSSTVTGDPQGLVRLIDEQIELYRKLEGLSRKQHECVEADDTDGLLAVLGQRQQLIDRITDASARMSPYRAQWDAHIDAMGESDRRRVRQGLDDLSTLMSSIAERDDRDRRAMEDRRDRVHAQITGVKRGGQAVSAYAGREQRSPRFQDRQA